MIRIALISSILLLQVFNASAQRWKSALRQPVMFHHSYMNNQLFEESDYLNLTDKLWIVYNINSATRTLNEPAGLETLKELSFMENFFVVEIKGPYIHIVKDNEISVEGSLSRNFIDYGWLHHEKLLMSSRCLVNSNGIPALAVAAGKFGNSQLNDDMIIVARPTTKFLYRDPDLQKVSTIALSEGTVYFVYKTTGTAALLGWVDRIDETNYHTGILGWTSLDNLVIFENRMAIEPNWETNAAFERKNKRIYSTIFFDPLSAANAYINSGLSNENAIWGADPLEERWEGDLYRFPVAGISGNIIRTGIFMQQETKMIHVSTRHQLAGSNELKKFVMLRDLNSDSKAYKIQNSAGIEELELKYLEGFTPLYHQSLRYPMYKFVYLLNRLEIMQIHQLYKGLQRSINENTFYTFLSDNQTAVKPLDTTISADSLTIDAVIQSKSGIPINSAYFGPAKLYQLSLEDDAYISAGRSRLLSKLDQLIKQLEFINHPEDPKFSFSSNGVMYYWISIDNFL